MNGAHGIRLRREDHELIVAVADGGSITRAAGGLHLTQSAVSHHLKSIEDLVGGRIFLREPRRTIPTAFGRECIQQARLVLEALRRADTTIVSSRPHQQPVVTIGTECYTSYHWLPQLTRAACLSRFKYRLNVAVDFTRRVVPALIAGEIDLAVVNSFADRNELTYVHLLADEIVLVVPGGHRLASKKYASAEDFEPEELLVYDSPDGGNVVIDELLHPSLVSPRAIHHVQLTEAIIYMVAAGWGIAPLAGWMVTPYLKANHLKTLRIGRRGFARQWRLAFRSADPRSSEFRKLGRLLSRELKRIMIS
jgi:LysR family transcriptional regulator, regulator for metE and metH